jgi:hypothetical protein
MIFYQRRASEPLPSTKWNNESGMKKSDLLRALQSEIRRHDFSTFLTEEPSMANGGPGVVVPGCPGTLETAVHDAEFHGSSGR